MHTLYIMILLQKNRIPASNRYTANFSYLKCQSHVARALATSMLKTGKTEKTKSEIIIADKIFDFIVQSLRRSCPKQPIRYLLCSYHPCNSRWCFPHNSGKK